MVFLVFTDLVLEQGLEQQQPVVVVVPVVAEVLAVELMVHD